MKWFVYAATLLLVFSASDLDFLPEIVSGVVLGLTLVALPTAIGTTILKHRLYGIDVIINRTLVYGSLTAMLLSVYFGGVATT